jgi:hypothetical protein
MSIDERLRDGLRLNGAAIPDDTESALDTIWRRRRRRLRLRVVAASVAVVGAAAIAPWAVDEFRDQSPVIATSSSSQLVGTWAVDVPAGSGEISGRWIVRVRPNGGLVLDPPAGFREQLTPGSTLQVTGSSLRTNALVDYPGCQLPGAAIGRYSWERTGSTVVFRVVSDGCEARQRLFAAPWEAP